MRKAYLRSRVRVIFRFCKAKRPSQSGTDEKNDANQIKKPSRRRFFYLKIVTYFDTKCTPLTTFR